MKTEDKKIIETYFPVDISPYEKEYEETIEYKAKIEALKNAEESELTVKWENFRSNIRLINGLIVDDDLSNAMSPDPTFCCKGRTYKDSNVVVWVIMVSIISPYYVILPFIWDRRIKKNCLYNFTGEDLYLDGYDILSTDDQLKSIYFFIENALQSIFDKKRMPNSYFYETVPNASPGKDDLGKASVFKFLFSDYIPLF